MSPKPLKNSKPSSILSAADLMPRNKEARHILGERAKHLAKQEADNQEKTGTVPYIRFRLGTNEYYGISYQYAKEVLRHIIPTTIPFAPNYITGVINRRGVLLPVFDLKKIFHIQPSDIESMHIILIASGNMTIGILADSVEGSDAYDPSNLDPPLPSAGGIKPDYLMGLHNGGTAIINADAILSESTLEMKI